MRGPSRSGSSIPPTLANLRYVPVLSEPLDSPAWHGRRGFVHQAVMADVPDLSGHQVYACGAPAMIDVARQTFVESRHLPPDEFFADSFTYAAQPA